MPGFIHSMTTSELQKDIAGRISSDWCSISLDGSAFDSSQFRVLQEVIDDGFWDMMSGEVLKILEHNLNLFKRASNKPVQDTHS